MADEINEGTTSIQTLEGKVEVACYAKACTAKFLEFLIKETEL